MQVQSRTNGQLLRWPLIAIACASATFAAAVPFSFADTAPTGCTDISTIPVTNGVDFPQGIASNIFQHYSQDGMAGCADCHTSADGTMEAAGNLDLDPSEPDEPSPYGNIVNVPSGEVSTLRYVVPGHPESSYLFMKVNCDNPPAGSRMPLDNYAGGLTPQQQAVIYDWIAGGATIEPTNTVFRGTFDIRGFFVDKVFANGFE